MELHQYKNLARKFIYFAGPEVGSFGENQEKSPEVKAPEGIKIDAGDKPLQLSEKLTDAERNEYSKARYDMAQAVDKLQPLTGTAAQIESAVTRAVNKIPLSATLTKMLKTKRDNAQHIFTVDTGTYFVEVELIPASETKAHSKVMVYKKDNVPANQHDVKDTTNYLNFKAKAIQELKGLTTRKEVREKGQALIEKYPAIKETIAEGNATYSSNHIVALKLASGEIADIWLMRQNGDAVIGVLPFKKD